MIRVENLSTFIFDESSSRFVRVVSDVSLSVRPGRVLLIIGESGSGKSSLADSIIQGSCWFPGVISGRLEIEGNVLFDVTREGRAQVFSIEHEDDSRATAIHIRRRYRCWRKRVSRRYRELYRQNRVRIVRQANIQSLNPYLRVRYLLRDARVKGEGEQWFTLLRQYGLVSEVKEVQSNPSFLDRYAKDLSGGQKTRLSVLLELESGARVIIADEPTTGLDPELKASLIDRFSHFFTADPDRHGIIISHDMDFVLHLIKKTRSDAAVDNVPQFDIGVMYGGRLVEYTDWDSWLRNCAHPYSMELIDHMVEHTCDVPVSRANRYLDAQPIDIHDYPIGCSYQSRCDIYEKLTRPQQNSCRYRKPVRQGEHGAECHFHELALEESKRIGESASDLLYSGRRGLLHEMDSSRSIDGPAPVLEAGSVSFQYAATESNGYRLLMGDDANPFIIRHGESVFVIGESGSGKTTLFKILTGLLEGYDGKVIYPQFGDDLAALLRFKRNDFRRTVQLVFQESGLAFNPMMTVAEVVREGYDNFHPNLQLQERDERCLALLNSLGISGQKYRQLACKLSGGEIKRVLFARGLAALGYNPFFGPTRPDGTEKLPSRILFVDELTSGYDPFVEGRVLSLLEKAIAQLDLTLIVASHNYRFVNRYPGEMKRVFRIRSGTIDSIVEEHR